MNRNPARYVRNVARKPGARLGASVAAVSVVALLIGAGAQNAAASSDAVGFASLLKSASTTTPTPNENKLAVNVGKVVAVTTDASGNSVGQGLYTQTQAAGTGSAEVTVPVGTPNPIDVNSFSRLNTNGDSIVYSINNSGNDVQQLTASGGSYTGELPVTFTVDLKVNGQPVDPRTATSITGDVELSYNFTNHTNDVETIVFKDAAGNVVTKQKNIAVPFAVTFASSFADGWANIDAPWAISGFTKGQVVTGATTLQPSASNNYDPNGTLTITAQAQNAKLPGASITIKPQNSGGVSSVADGTSKVGEKVDDALGKALPLLMGVEQDLGAASGKVGQLLDEKVNPVLNLLSKLKLNPAKANAIVEKAGTDASGLGDTLLGLNAAIDKAGQDVAKSVVVATSAAKQQNLAKTINSLTGTQTSFENVSTKLAKVAKELGTTYTYLGKDVGTSLGALICPGGGNCTWGQALEGISTDLLASTCVTGHNTQLGLTAPGSTIMASLDSVIAKGGSKGWAQDLATLRSLLNAQIATSYPVNCAPRAQAVTDNVNGLLSNLGKLSHALDDLLPLINSVSSELGDVIGALTKLEDQMPSINASMTKAVALLGGVAEADTEAEALLNDGVLKAVANITPAVEGISKLANTLGAAAEPLKRNLDGLPKLISELSYGTVGSFVADAQNLNELSIRLTDVANEGVATTNAVDAKFNSGEGFPYGSATGGDAATSAIYSFEVESASADQASTVATVGFALLLLAAGIGSAIWLGGRSSSS